MKLQPLFLYEGILNALDTPILVADTEHHVVFMNQAAKAHYRGGESLLGSNLLDCHNPASQAQMKAILKEMQENDLDEQMISENENEALFMVAVRHRGSYLLGYFEQYRKKSSTKPRHE